MNLIVGKRQIILAALILGLSIAVYLNWQYADLGGLELTGTVEGGKNYGDAQYVDGTVSSETDAFFAEAKLSRTRSRDEATEALNTLLQDQTLSTEQRATFAMKVSAIADAVQAESKIENLIKSKGFNECIVYFDAENVDVIVRTEGLLANEVAQMKDIILQEVSVPVENISIVEIK
jgi:stage III sporulation protein AH